MKLPFQQIQDELGGEIDARELADVLREFHHEGHRQDGIVGSLVQLLTVAAQAAGWIELDRDGDMSCPLREAAALNTATPVCTLPTPPVLLPRRENPNEVTPPEQRTVRRHDDPRYWQLRLLRLAECPGDRGVPARVG
ncbi:hypothetical protein NGM37_25020 [Streptomyces sp. TRM76130]|nr:hypothetical protein [Streptomyces sp. TRM76130]